MKITLYALVSRLFRIRGTHIHEILKKGGHQIRGNTCRNFTISTSPPSSPTIFHTSNKYAHIPSARYETSPKPLNRQNDRYAPRGALSFRLLCIRRKQPPFLVQCLASTKAKLMRYQLSKFSSGGNATSSRLGRESSRIPLH